MPSAPLALSLFYLTSFGLFGVYLPYFNPYLEGLGFSALQIGLISALVPLSNIFVPALSGRLSDRIGRRRPLILASSILATLSFSIILGARSFMAVTLVIGTFAILRAPAVPLVDATAMEVSERGGPHYGRMRVWGSVAFIVVSLLTGWSVGLSGASVVVPIALCLLLLNVLACLTLPGDPPRRPPAARAAGIGVQARTPAVILFLAACVLSQAAHGPYYVFFSIHLQRAGYRPSAIGLLWALAVACEIAAMLRMRHLLDRFGTSGVMIAALLLAAARWGICASSVAMPAMIVAQALHAASFAMFHVAAVTHVHRLFGEEHGAGGQALYASATYGLGNVLGMVLSGALVDRVGIHPVFAGAAGLALVGASLMAAAGRRRLWTIGRL